MTQVLPCTILKSPRRKQAVYFGVPKMAPRLIPDARGRRFYLTQFSLHCKQNASDGLFIETRMKV